MVGKKDYINISINQYMQKPPVLVNLGKLGNLKELYIAFKTKFPTEKLVFPSFVVLKT